MAITTFSTINADNNLFNLYGDGSDGSITHSSDVNDSGVIFATDYTVESGTTVTVSSKTKLIVFATDKITINGTIDGRGQGGAGGVPEYDQDFGWSNADGVSSHGPTTASAGDGGVSGDDRTPGSGGSTTYGSTGQNRYGYRFLFGVNDNPWLDTITGTITVGHGGGSGGRGDDDDGDIVSEGEPGRGGNGGAGVFLIAPTIEINGTIDVSGEDGGDGEDIYEAAGGGGGGSGGNVILLGEGIVDNGTYDFSGGAGGDGGTGSGGGDGDPGQPGEDGKKYIIQP